jgi:hypothetical protein
MYAENGLLYKIPTRSKFTKLTSDQARIYSADKARIYRADQQWWAKLLRLLTVNSLSYFVKIKY